MSNDDAAAREAEGVQSAICGMFGLRRWVLPVLVVLGLLGTGLGLVPEFVSFIGMFKFLFAVSVFSLSIVVLLAWLYLRKFVDRICGCLIREDIIAMRDCLKRVIRRELEQTALEIQIAQDNDAPGSPRAAEIRERKLKPLFREARRWGLLAEDLKRKGYKPLFVKRLPDAASS